MRGSSRALLAVPAVLAICLIPAGTLHSQTRTFDLLTASVDDIQAAVAAGALTYERRGEVFPY